MPELPEVETIVSDLKKKVLKRTFLDLWTDSKKLIKKPKDFEVFKKNIKNKKIINIKRRGKNIIFFLSDNKILLIHQKLTGHLLFGKWSFKNGKWTSNVKGPLYDDPKNGFLHLIFFLDKGQQIALSDLRKFAKAELWDKREFEESEDFRKLGPEPLDKRFTLSVFTKAILRKKGGIIKKILMDQNVLVGIGNIYSDEILWEAKINPLRNVSTLSEKELKNIYKAIKKILLKALHLRGDSMSDYRTIFGRKGGYQKVQRVYQQEGKKCPRKDGGIIQRKKIGGRSAHFCLVCQK